MVWIVNNILQGENTMSTAQKIDSFRGKYYFLSNFFPAPVIYQGLTYQNNEAAFQAQKTLSQEQKIVFTSITRTRKNTEDTYLDKMKAVV